MFLSCARAISCALVQVGRDAGRAHDLGDHALDLLVDHRSFVHLDVVSTARTTTRVRGLWGGAARVEWRKGEDQHIGHTPPCLLSGRTVCRPESRGVDGGCSCADSGPFESVVRKS